MATFPISDTFNLVVSDGLQEEVQSLIDSIETSADIPLADVDFTGLVDSVLAGLGDGELSPVELTGIAIEAIDLVESLGITDAEAATIFSNLNDLVDATGSLETDDSLTGTASNDGLYGGLGNDTLTGTAAGTTGVGEVDVLISGGGSDTFVLGNTTTAFYSDGDLTTAGTADYAAIADFNAESDTIQLYGTASDYTLTELPESFGVGGTGIYYNQTGASSTPELIGVVVGASLTNFDSGFTFVSGAA